MLFFSRFFLQNEECSQFTILQTNIAPPDRMGIAAKLPNQRLLGTPTCFFAVVAHAPLLPLSSTIGWGDGRGVAGLPYRLEPVFSGGPNGHPVFDSQLSHKVCNKYVEAALAGRGHYASLDVQNPNFQRATPASARTTGTAGPCYRGTQRS